MNMYIILMVLVMGASWLVQNRLKSKFKKYSNTPIRSNLSGKEIAEKMLADNGIYDVKVLSVAGQPPSTQDGKPQ
jgi:Zn-dependent membrane protease YugP